jgi:hypothetical protein
LAAELKAMRCCCWLRAIPTLRHSPWPFCLTNSPAIAPPPHTKPSCSTKSPQIEEPQNPITTCERVARKLMSFHTWGFKSPRNCRTSLMSWRVLENNCSQRKIRVSTRIETHQIPIYHM